jgi:hypothetical protein
MAKRNFLLGYGENLTDRVRMPGRPVEKRLPYSVREAIHRLQPMVVAASTELDALPGAACPDDRAVALLRLHPEFLAKSYFPEHLLNEVGVEAVGSRPSRVKPGKSSRGEPAEKVTTDVFVAGPRERFRSWAGDLGRWSEEHDGAVELPRVEAVRALNPDDRLRGTPNSGKEVLLETALHAGPGRGGDVILEAFEEYASGLDARVDLDRRLYAGGLCFVPVRSAVRTLRELARFSFLRVARPMPVLRPFAPVVRSFSGPKEFGCTLPTDGPLNPNIRAVVIDGGMHALPAFSRWVRSRDARGVGTVLKAYLDHGSWVTSALLFGSLKKGEPMPRPYCFVENVRVLDKDSGNDDDLFDVLHRVQDVLLSGKFQFANISIGPDVPIDDDDVHAWTAVIDDTLSGGDTLATVASGNGGERDVVLGFNRVQVPADCVNALGVGAADSRGDRWRRAPYSSQGPGRSPGVVKPDVLAFGGSGGEPFWVVNPEKPTQTSHVAGTSFASPEALRMGIGVRAHFGDVLGALAIRALLVHATDDGGGNRHEVGWGRVPEDLEEIVVCPPGMARVVYQGELVPGQYLRARIPMPPDRLAGLVTLRATFCYATATDPDHPGNYTRAGLEVIFRPDEKKFDKKAPDAHHPKSAPFFQLRDYSTEQELRRDAHKWETVLHREKRVRGSGLLNPMFDVHYNAREGGAASTTSERIPYALVVTVTSSGTSDLYDKVVRRYRSQIQPLTPVLEVPVRVRS